MKKEEIRMLSDSLNFNKKLVVVVFILTLLTPLFEGLSIGLLLPVLQIVGKENISLLVKQGGYWKILDTIFKTFGFQLTLVNLLLAILLGILLKQIVGYFQIVNAKKIQFEYTAFLRADTFDKLIRADINFFTEKRTGDITNTLSVQAWSSGALLFSVIQLITTSFFILVYVLLLMLISWQMTLLTLIVFIFITFFIQPQVRFSRIYGKEYAKLLDDFHDFITQKMTGIRVVKNAAAESAESEKLEAIVNRISLNRIKKTASRAKINFVFEPFIGAIALVIFYLGVRFLQMELAALAVFFFILLRLSPRIMGITAIRHGIADNLAGLENVEQTLSEAETMAKIKGGDKIFKSINDSLEISKVSFNYDNKIPVLKDIEFVVKKNDMVAIVGASGAGKSTIVDLFLRFYDPISGQILIDGTDVKEFDTESLRRKIGYASQDIFLFNDTIAANIGYGYDSISQDDIISASKIARAHDFIIKLPKGYKTIIGERGVKLSGGQKQRLALARAIVRNPEILILDEATSHLDSESEMLIQKSLNEIRGNTTIIAIAHRLSTIVNADNIVVLEDGQVVEKGTHKELLKMEGYYTKYYNLQQNINHNEG